MPFFPVGKPFLRWILPLVSFLLTAGGTQAQILDVLSKDRCVGPGCSNQYVAPSGLHKKKWKYKQITFRQYQKQRQRQLKQRDVQTRLAFKHRNLQNKTQARYIATRRDLQTKTMPSYVARHQNLQNKTQPRFVVHHRDLQTVCQPRYIVKRTDLQTVCQPSMRVRHRDLQSVCLPKYQVKHRDLQSVCLPRVQIKHKSMDRYSCTQGFQVCHTPMHKYQVPCDPNMTHTSNMERVAKDIKVAFTNHRKHCKINSNYSGLSVGQLIETEDYGTGIVVDFVVRNRTQKFYRWGADSTKAKIQKKTRPYIDQLVVEVARGGDWYGEKGEPLIKRVKLTPKETKTLMLKHFVLREQYEWLLRVYPEERHNLEALKLKYKRGRGDGKPEVPLSVPKPEDS